MLRPVDLFVLLKLVAKEDAPWSQMGLARELGISSQSVNVALERSRVARLYSPERRKVRLHALGEAVIFGGRYFLAAELGARALGVPTASGAPPLNETLVQIPHAVPVWSHPDGTVQGPSLEPLHPSVPTAAREDPALYALLALFDSLRIGDARERGLATRELEARLGLRTTRDLKAA